MQPAIILGIILGVLAGFYTRGFSRRLKLARFLIFSAIRSYLHYNIGKIAAMIST
jgi:hypothetical protein